MNFLIIVLVALIYIVVCTVLMNRYRRTELKERSPWAGKSGIEREFVVFGEVVMTPLVLVFSYLGNLKTNKDSSKTKES